VIDLAHLKGSTMSNVGFRVFKKVQRTSKDLVEKFRPYPVAVIGDVMGRIACLDARIKPLNSKPMCGPAFTVRARVGDNLMLHHALDIAEPGDVVIVESGGDLVNALAGENMANWAHRRGIAGLVIDGSLRDLDALAKLDMACYCAGVQPNGPYKFGPGEINVPISCGGITVNPGDLVVGDADGVIIVPRQEAENILAKTIKKQAQEVQTGKDIVAGTWDRSSYTEEAMTKLGCTFIDDFYK
jgi:regulator of RNase E activity RraA